MTNEKLSHTFANALSNMFYLVQKTNDGKTGQHSIIAAIAHLLLACIMRFEVKTVVDLIMLALSDESRGPYPEKVQRWVLEPVLGLAGDELRDACSSDCMRVSADPLVLDEQQILRYWDRFEYNKSNRNEEERQVPKEGLLIERHDAACKVGFNVGAEKGCPCLMLICRRRN